MRTITAFFLFVSTLAAVAPYEIGAAGVAGGRLLLSQPSTFTSLENQWTRLNDILGKSADSFSDPQLRSQWVRAQYDARRALAILGRIAEIDNKKPANWAVVMSSLRAMAEDTREKDRTEWGGEFWKRLLMEAVKSDLQKEFRDADHALGRKLAALAALDNSGSDGAIEVRHVPSWQGAYDNELVLLTNRTGRALSYGAAFVAIRGTDGSSRTHLHYFSQWKPGETIQAKYSYWMTDYAYGQTVDVPARVDVRVFSPDSVHTGEQEWTEESRTRQIFHYVDEHLTMQAHYLGEYLEEGSNDFYHPGVKFSIKGLNRVPLKSVTIRFTRRGETLSATWTFNRYVKSGEPFALRAKAFSAFSKNDPPERKEVILTFTDAGKTARYSW